MAEMDEHTLVMCVKAQTGSTQKRVEDMCDADNGAVEHALGSFHLWDSAGKTSYGSLQIQGTQLLLET